jgi:hypothetical protein
MKRYTFKKEDTFCIDIMEVHLSTMEVWGEAIDRLAEFENFYEQLQSERSRIIAQLDHLRETGKTKSATFRQLFASKISIEMIIERVDRHIGNKKS